jgi:hypothetical protein
MANVVALPTAVAEPLPKRRWHGPYPKGVTSISLHRLKRRCEEIDDREQAMEATRAGKDASIAVLKALLDKAHRGDVVGLLLVYELRDGAQGKCRTGPLADVEHAADAATRLTDWLQYDA